MTPRLGSGDYVYDELSDWAKLPQGWTFKEVVDVVVDSQDRVYVFNRGDHPMMIFERDGSFVASWGEGTFTRPHGLTLAPDETIYCIDDQGHCIRKFTLDGQLLMTIGTPGEPVPRHSGQPFNQPTGVTFDPETDELYISDGYGNAKVHKFSADGKHLFSWGEYGTEPGQFNLVHIICTDSSGKVYVADRENHRIQVFDDQGNYLEQWNNLHRPCALHIEGELVYIGQLPTHLEVNADYPNIGACVSIHDLTGRCLTKLGDAYPGEEPGQFIAPHGLTVDSHGDIYIGEVSWSGYGKKLSPPRIVRSFRKLVKVLGVVKVIEKKW